MYKLDGLLEAWCLWFEYNPSSVSARATIRPIWQYVLRAYCGPCRGFKPQVVATENRRAQGGREHEQHSGGPGRRTTPLVVGDDVSKSLAASCSLTIMRSRFVMNMISRSDSLHNKPRLLEFLMRAHIFEGQDKPGSHDSQTLPFCRGYMGSINTPLACKPFSSALSHLLLLISSFNSSFIFKRRQVLYCTTMLYKNSFCCTASWHTVLTKSYLPSLSLLIA